MFICARVVFSSMENKNSKTKQELRQCEHEITTRTIDKATKQTFCLKCNYIFGHSVDHSIKTEECKQNGHRWQISGLYKHNPHLWCSNCGWYLETSKIKEEKGLTKIFIDLLNNDNPEGFYLTEGSYEWLMENKDY